MHIVEMMEEIQRLFETLQTDGFVQLVFAQQFGKIIQTFFVNRQFLRVNGGKKKKEDCLQSRVCICRLGTPNRIYVRMYDIIAPQLTDGRNNQNSGIHSVATKMFRRYTYRAP